MSIALFCFACVRNTYNTMSNENKSIHEFDVNLICEFFCGMNRQGPGSSQATLRALSFINGLTDQSLIADLGCGTGGQTVTLAQHVSGHITGLDIFPGFIDIFNRNVKRLGLQNRAVSVVGSMDNPPFRDGELDLIWSEGAIYNIGFERGLNEWRKYLKTGGYVAVTECCWLTDSRPAEINDYWMDAYPEIDTVYSKMAKIYKTGYLPIATFVLSESCWIDNYYVPKAVAMDAFLKKHTGNRTAEEFANMQSVEEAMYRKYKRYYGYVFFIAKKM